MRFIEWAGVRLFESFVEMPRGWATNLLEEFFKHQGSVDKSHKIAGRWENQYLTIDHAPSARIPMRFARNMGKDGLDISSMILFEAPSGSPNPHPPFWFNVAGKGEKTGLHDHAHGSILSAVTYLQAEENCGHLYFRKEGFEDLTIKPEVGKIIIFPPSLLHGVHANHSSTERISFAFNLFPFPLVQSKIDGF